jgi:hypothetical protein
VQQDRPWCMLKLTASVKMRIEEVDKWVVSSLQLDQAWDIVYYIEGVCPFISFSPPVVRTSPRSRSIPRFYEPSLIIKDLTVVTASGREESLVCCFPGKLSYNGGSMIVDWRRISEVFRNVRRMIENLHAYAKVRLADSEWMSSATQPFCAYTVDKPALTSYPTF